MKLRRSMMFMPGNNPGMLQSAGIYGTDTVIFDLEDSVSIGEKDAARHLVANAIKYISRPCEVAVRPNHLSTPYGLDDLKAILPSKPDLIRLPKVETADEIKRVDDLISEAEVKNGFPAGSIRMMGAIETAKGLMKAYDIATASPRMVALAIGGEDFIADLKTTRTKSGRELFVARGQLILAARAAGIQAIDTVFSDVSDDEGLFNETVMIKEMGFDGKSIVNPRQMRIVHEIFTPTAKEIEYAQRVIAASNDAKVRGLGVVSLNGKMIDTPIVDRAERVLAYAAAVNGHRGGNNHE